MNAWEIFKKYPPYYVRCLARESLGGNRIRAISDEEISIKSKLSIERVKEIYNSTTWDDVTLKEFRVFTEACNYDPHDSGERNRINSYNRTPVGSRFRYLVKSPWWTSVFQPLLRKMKQNAVPLDL